MLDRRHMENRDFVVAIPFGVIRLDWQSHMGGSLADPDEFGMEYIVSLPRSCHDSKGDEWPSTGVLAKFG
jgi:hypothetical protein